MNQNLKDTCKEIDDFFASPPTSNQKAWDIINDFYHMILTFMDKNEISRAELAKRLGKSRAAISQMFNKTPNLTIKKMVEITEAIGLDINISSPQIGKQLKEKVGYRVVLIPISYQEYDYRYKVAIGQKGNYPLNQRWMEIAKKDDLMNKFSTEEIGSSYN
ncbi:MAG TPA: helix-turn-helix transcriptional regulator [Candidatus Lokiarchaeia archaeon]